VTSLEASSRWCLAPPPGCSRGNPDSSWDRVRATLSCVVLPAGVLALVAPSAGGCCGASWLSASTSGLDPSTRRSGEHVFGLGVLRVKTLHQPRPLPVMAALLDVAPLVGGITVEALTASLLFALSVQSVSSSACLRLGGARPRGSAWLSERRLRVLPPPCRVLRCF
jgi:hypothetical protein